MPFDNTKVDDEVLEALQLIREGVSRAWCVGELESAQGQHCLVGWIQEVSNRLELRSGRLAGLLASQLPSFLRLHDSMSRLWRWNDSQLSNQPVIDLIDRAIEARREA